MKFKIFQEKPEILEQCRVILAGWHGLGETGYITVTHLVQELEMQRVATILSNSSPPFISVQNKQLRLPFEIYAKEGHDLAIFVPHLQPYRHVQIEFSERFSEWILNHEQFEIAYFLGGVDETLKSGKTALQYIPSRALFNSSRVPADFLDEVQNNLLDSGLFVAGPLAIMLGYLDIHMFPAVGILAYAARERPDPAAAAAAIEKLNNLLNIDIATEKLIQNAKIIEESIKRQLAPLEETNKESFQSRRMYT